DGASVFVMFMKEPLDRGTWKRVLDLRSATDDFQMKSREVYWLSHRGFSGSTAAPAFGKLCAAGTMRNITTVKRLGARAGFGTGWGPGPRRARTGRGKHIWDSCPP